MAYKKLFKELFEQYTAKYKRKPKGLELIKIKLKAADLQRDADKLIEFPRDKIKKFFDPNDPLPYYNETPGEFARRETPGSIENLREEMKIAYRNEFDRLTGNETAEELTEMLKNLDIDGVPFAEGGSTSTGLNYLLGEDDTNSRVPYATGGRRGFLKLLAGLGAAGAAFKSGLLSLGKGGVKPVAKVAAEEITRTPPPYFLNLVAKIKTLGDDVTPSYAVKDREKVTKYKDYELTEDVTTGEQTIQRMKVLDDDSASYYGQPLTEETYMSYKPGKGLADETTKGKTIPDEYDEGTALLRSDRGNAGDIVEESAEISEDVIKDGTMFEDNLSDFGKAEGGRIDRSGGGIMKIINKLKNKLKVKQSGNSVKDFVEKRKFLKSMVGETEKNKKARELDNIKKSTEEYMKQYKGFEFPSNEQIKIDLEKRIQPILNKGRKLNAGGGIITKLIKKLNTIDPGSTKRGKLSKPMSKKAKDKKELREAIENFSKRNRAR